MPLKIISDFISCLFYIRYCTSKTPTEAFKSAVIMGDVGGFDYLLRTYHKNTTDAIVEYYSEEFLITSYYNSYFSLAERLIKARAKLKGEYIAHIKNLPKIEIVQEHLKNIENYIDQKRFIVLSQIILAHYSSAIVDKHNKICIDYEGVLLSISHTNDKNYTSYFKTFYSELYNHNNPIINSIVIFFGVFNHLTPSIKVLAPVVSSNLEGAFYSSDGKLIYTPFYHFDLQEKAYFIHESSHYLVDKLYKNIGRPFAKNNDTQLEDFDIAATKVLHSIGKTMNLNFDNLPKGYNYHTAAYDLLFDSSIALFFFNSLLRNDTSLEVKDIIFKHIDNSFNISSSLINLYGKEEAVHITINNIIKDLNFTSDYVIILERIGEYVSRATPHGYSTELLVRLPEFIIMNLDQEALSHFAPLENYWLEHISPAIQKYSDMYQIKECGKINDISDYTPDL